MHKEFLQEQYDLLMRYADKIRAEYDPCQIQDGICRRGRNGGKSLCCAPCPFLGAEGSCTVECVACHAWLCKDAVESLPEEVKKAMGEINVAIDNFGFRMEAPKELVLNLASRKRGIP